MKFHFSISLLALVLCFSACDDGQQDEPVDSSIGDQAVTVFSDEHHNFAPGIVDTGGTIMLDAGRTRLRTVALPQYQKDVRVSIRMRLVSNGDPWDKSGSVFLLSPEGAKQFIDFDRKQDSLPSMSENGVLPLVTPEADYSPPAELLRFMTPFGVGYYSDTLSWLRPTYIPKWEEEMVWEQDITHLLPLLTDSVVVGVFIDTWTKEGYRYDLSLHFDETEARDFPIVETEVLPLVNTAKYLSVQGLYDEFSRQPLTQEFELPAGAKNVRLYYTTTGHGGHAAGDEFIPEENLISVNGKEVKRFIPWRDDCASFRRFNPSSGVFAQQVFWQGDSIPERIASSDLSRSNWCPGSAVTPEAIALGDLPAGTHTLEIDIPDAQELNDETQEMNYWMVNAVLVWEVGAAR